MAGEGAARPTTLPTNAATDLVVDAGTGSLAVVNLKSGSADLLKPVAFEASGGRAFVAESLAANAVAVIDPWQPFVSIFARGSNNAAKMELPRRIAVAVNPQALAFTPDGDWLMVACDPPGKADRPLCLIDLKTGAVSRRTIPGSSNLRGIAIDPRGRFALAVHLVPKSDLPATQIEQGWVFTNAISYVPLDESQSIVTLPLDLRTQGFANPEGVAIVPDGTRAYVAHAGADVVSVIDLPSLVAVATESVENERKNTAGRTAVGRTTDSKTRVSTAYRPEDLRLTRKYVRARIAVGVNPRGIAVSADGKFVCVVNRLDESVSLIDTATNSVVRSIPLSLSGECVRDALVVRGEKLFQSGKLAFSGQFSCASCHPDGQSDGLNWDLPADGFNNFHNTKSLLGTTGTAPYGWTGTSPTLRERFEGTLRHLFQHEPTDEESAALETYLAQLDYRASMPKRVEPNSGAAQRGRALFQGLARCNECHRGTKLTDRQQHDVGTGSGTNAAYDTPSLVWAAETAPYLHDGRAETLADVFTHHNPAGLHGNAAELSPEQLGDLVEYLKSL